MKLTERKTDEKIEQKEKNLAKRYKRQVICHTPILNDERRSVVLERKIKGKREKIGQEQNTKDTHFDTYFRLKGRVYVKESWTDRFILNQCTDG